METKAKLNIVSKDDQKAIALDILKRYPKAQKVSVASDGQAFITDDGDAAAKNHSKVNIYGKELELAPFTRDGLNAPSTPSKEKHSADSPSASSGNGASKTSGTKKSKEVEKLVKKVAEKIVKTAENAVAKIDETTNTPA